MVRMVGDKRVEHAATTLSFEAFWTWLQAHPNCIIRAGTPETVLYDDEELHWHFTAESETLVIQVLRGKRLVGELLLAPGEIAYVQGVAGEEDEEYVFELVSETETDRVAAFHFVLSHSYEAQARSAPGRAVH